MILRIPNTVDCRFCASLRVVKGANAYAFVTYMTHYRSTAPAISPECLKVLNQLGEHIHPDRLRRKLSAGQIAERAGISRKTVCHKSGYVMKSH